MRMAQLGARSAFDLANGIGREPTVRNVRIYLVDRVRGGSGLSASPVRGYFRICISLK